jgi:hypothetical protein
MTFECVFAMYVPSMSIAHFWHYKPIFYNKKYIKLPLTLTSWQKQAGYSPTLLPKLRRFFQTMSRSVVTV